MVVGFLVAGLVGLLVVAPVAVLLANRVIRAGTEIGQYCDDILANGVALTGDLDPLPALADTAALTGAVTENAVRYVTVLQRMV